MNFDSVNTDSITVSEGELDQLSEIIGKEQTITAKQLVIDTEGGHRLVVEPEATNLEIENRP